MKEKQSKQTDRKAALSKLSSSSYDEPKLIHPQTVLVVDYLKVKSIPELVA
jgi:hypothetical protein